METQTKLIKATLDQGQRITAIDALNKFGCFRLSARIKDLKDQGYPIEDRFIETETGKRVKEYWRKK